MSLEKDRVVSCVITTCDRPEMAKRATWSAVRQTYEHVEVLVVEDGSSSGIQEWLEAQGFTSVRYVRHRQNRGLAAARNTGLCHARGKYVAYLDDDDEWLPEKLAKQVELFESKGEVLGVVYCGAFRVLPERKAVGEKRPQLRGDIRTAIREKGLSTIPSSGLFRRQVLEQVGGYDENLVSHVDFDMWLQLARGGYAAEYVDECLVKVYKHRGYKMTADAASRVRATRAFCHKWQPYLTSWFGPGEAKKYLSHFRGLTMGMLGRACLYEGNRRQGAKYFLLAIWHHPARRAYYEGLVFSAIGKSWYDRLIRIRTRCIGGKG